MRLPIRPVLYICECVVLLGTLLASAGALAGDKSAGTSVSAVVPPVSDASMSTTTSDTSPKPASVPERPAEGLSLAERIGHLQQTIKTDEERLAALEAKLRERDGEFESASGEFQQREAEFEKEQELLKTAESDADAAQIAALREVLRKVNTKRSLARERFDLAIEAKKTSHQQVVELRAKIERDGQTLERLLTPSSAEAETSESPAEALSQTANPPTSVGVHSPARDAKTPGAAPASNTPATGSPAASEGEAAPAPTDQAIDDKETPRDQEVEKVQQQVSQAEAAKEVAQKEAADVGQRLESLDRNIALEQKARESARRQGSNAEARIALLEEELQQAINNGADHGSISKTRDQIREAQQRIHESRVEVQDRAARLDKLQAERADLLREQVAALQEVERANQEALMAQESLEAIQNPFATRNVLKWLVAKGPKLLAILIAALTIHFLVNLLTGRIVALLAGKEGDGRKKDREKRASTLVGVFHNTSVMINYVGATLATLDVAGLPIAPLLGGAAVVGLAVAFASQNLIKDYFCGFIILLEDQYSVNDVIRIGGITGLVERVTLRVTVLRDLEAVHFIPHGEISSVSNLTHKWSRAVFDVGVAYGEDIDHVMEVLLALGKEMRADPVFGPMILEDMEMLGLDSFGDSAIMVKFFIKTKPLKQWSVRRELNRRIKNKFDELGIEIPFPHRTVYHRLEENQAVNPLEQFRKKPNAEAA